MSGISLLYEEKQAVASSRENRGSNAKLAMVESQSTGFMKHELHFDPKLVRMSYALKAHVIQRHE